MTDDDLHTRLTLLERTAVSKDQLVEREDKLLGRFDQLMQRYIAQIADDQRHQFKVFGHEMADQLRASEKKMQDELDARDAPAQPTEQGSKKSWRGEAMDMARGKHGADLKWIGIGMIAMAVAAMMYAPWLKAFLPN